MNGTEVSLARAIRGPITLITLGALFAMNNFTEYQFRETWPVLLIVFGLLSLLGRATELPPPPPPAPRPMAGWPPPPSVPVQGAGTYRQTNYPGAESHPSTSPPSTTPPPPEGGAA